MATTSNIPLTFQVKWSEVSLPLKEFAAKSSTPNIIKVTKGQYRNIGVAKTVNSELIIHSIRTTKKILAETLKIKDNKRLPVNDQKLSLPISYQGWFELLSEDGKAVKPISSVSDLAKLFPQSCLVREATRGIVPKENGELTLDKSRPVYAGEHLTLVGDLTIPVLGSKGISKKRLLRCFDQKGDSVYFAFDQKGLFSPVAGQGNISGVHNIRGLIEKFRLPIIVRLVHGIIPSRLDKSQFTGVFRLIAPYSDETAFVCPLKRDAKMVPISTREPLKLSIATNLTEIKDTDEYRYHLQRCSNMVASYMNSIHVLVNIPTEALLKSREEIRTQQQQSLETTATVVTTPNNKREEDILFDEIDDIYQYVRDGGPPPKPRPRPKETSTSSQGHGGATFITSAAQKELSSSDEQLHQKQDYDYWEEPIYEQIASVQKKKQALQNVDVVQTGTTITPGTTKEQMERRQVFRHLSEEKPTSRPLSFVKTETINGPRSVTQDVGFTFTTSTTDDSASSTKEPVFEEQPPPIPPKKNSEYHYSFHPDTSLSSSPPNNNSHLRTKPFQSGSSYPPGASPVSDVTSSAAGAYPSHVKQLPGAGVIQYPRYVAVARVGDDDHSPASSEGSYHSNNNNSSENHENAFHIKDVDTAKKNLQTLQL